MVDSVDSHDKKNIVIKRYLSVHVHIFELYLYVFWKSHQAQLDGDYVTLFQQKCRMMNLPIQLPIDVCVLKRVHMMDKATGRSTEYKTDSDELVAMAT